jgi:hypothetical protein
MPNDGRHGACNTLVAMDANGIGGMGGLGGLVLLVRAFAAGYGMGLPGLPTGFAADAVHLLAWSAILMAALYSILATAAVCRPAPSDPQAVVVPAPPASPARPVSTAPVSPHHWLARATGHVAALAGGTAMLALYGLTVVWHCAGRVAPAAKRGGTLHAPA